MNITSKGGDFQRYGDGESYGKLEDIGREYGYIKIHKKTIKNGKARTRERKSEQKPEAKPRKSQAAVKRKSNPVNNGTDKTKITRKPSKNGKARTRERKSEQKPEAKPRKSQAAVKRKSNPVKSSQQCQNKGLFKIKGQSAKSLPQKEPEQNPETSTEKVQNPNLENTTHVPSPEEEESIFIEIPKPKAKKTVNLDPNSPNLIQIGLKDALVEMPKFNKWLSSLLRNKEKLEEIAITTVNAECSAIIMNKVPEKLEDPGKFLIPCALQELNRTSALADSGASINLLPHSIYKKLELEALTPTRMTLELANRSITHPMGIAEDVVVRVDGFTFLADFVVVNFEPDPRVPIILGRPFLRTAKALIDLYEETLTLRVGKDELVYYADKSEKNKNKHCVHAISVIDFSKDDPFSGSTTTHSDDPSPSSSPVKTSDNFEKFADELAPLDSLPPGNDDSTLKKDLHGSTFSSLLKDLFSEFDDNFKSSNVNPLLLRERKDVLGLIMLLPKSFTCLLSPYKASEI
ncbi:reverse transcriptase domain-containing protein [Tanacetum coccineum]